LSIYVIFFKLLETNKIMNKKGIIFSIQRFSIYNGPGIRTAVFLKGCPLRCLWCSNPEGINPNLQIIFRRENCTNCGECVSACPFGAITMSKEKKIKIDYKHCNLCMKCVDACGYRRALEKVGEEITAEEVVKEVMKDIPFFKNSNGGITLTGGEPLFQIDFAKEILKICKEKSIHTTLDTSGYTKLSDVEKVIDFVDLVLLDIKHMDSHIHKKFCGKPNEVILENAKWLAKNTKVRISFPLIPGFNDSDENIKKVAEFAAQLKVEVIDIEPLHKLAEIKYKDLGMESPFRLWKKISDEEVAKVREIIESYGLKTTKGRTIL